MGTERKPLAERLGQMEQGCPAHLEHAARAIRAWACITMGEYLCGHEAELRGVARLLGTTRESLSRMPYREAASRVARLWQDPERRGRAGTAAIALSLPFIDRYRTGKDIYG